MPNSIVPPFVLSVTIVESKDERLLPPLVDERGDEARPAGLVRRPQTLARIAMKILVEKQHIRARPRRPRVRSCAEAIPAEEGRSLEPAVHHRSGATSDLLGLFNRGFLFERNAFLTAYKNYEPGLWERITPAVMLTLMARTDALLAANPGADRKSQVSHDFSLGVQWRPDEHWGVWAEHHWINGTAILQRQENPPPVRDQRWSMLMLMAGYKF